MIELRSTLLSLLWLWTKTTLAPFAIGCVVGGWALASCGCSGADFAITEENANADTATEGYDSANTLGPDSGGGEHPSVDSGGGSEVSFADTGSEATTIDSPSETSTAVDSLPPVDSCAFDASDHHNGYDGPYTYCAPKGSGSTPSSYSLGMALAARASSSVAGGVDTSGSCAGGTYVRRAGTSYCVTWVYAGVAFGRVSYGGTAAACSCPEATGPRWD